MFPGSLSFLTFLALEHVPENAVSAEKDSFPKRPSSWLRESILVKWLLYAKEKAGKRMRQALLGLRFFGSW